MKAMRFAVVIGLLATCAHAEGIDLSIVACPGNAGVANERMLDCAADDSVTVFAVFQPFEAIPDMVWLDVTMSLVSVGDFEVSPFWSFDASIANNRDALTVTHLRPASGCLTYLDAWNGGSFWTAQRFSTAFERLTVTSYRFNTKSVLANEKLFGFRLKLDLRTSSEAGGGVFGCRNPVCIVINEAVLRTASGSPTTVLTSGSVFGTHVTFNGGTSEMCAAVPTRRATWGRLKALYR